MQKALPPATVKYDIVSPVSLYRIDFVDNPTCNIRDFYIYERSDFNSIQKRKLATLTSKGVYLFPFGNQITREEINSFLAGLPIASSVNLKAVSLKPGHVLRDSNATRMFNNLSTPMFIGNDDNDEDREIQSVSFEFNRNKKLWIEKVFAFYLLTGRPQKDTIRDLVLGLGFDVREINPVDTAKRLLRSLQRKSEKEKRETGIFEYIYKYHVMAKISIKKNGRLNLDGIYFTSGIAQRKVAGRRKMNVQKESTEILNSQEHQFCKEDEGIVLLIPLSTLRICYDYLMEADSLKLASEIGELENKILC